MKIRWFSSFVIQGITIPSQRRYIEYFTDYIKQNRVYQSDIELRLERIEILVPKTQLATFAKCLKVKIYADKFKKIFDSPKTKINTETSSFCFEFKEAFLLEEDIKFSFHNKKRALLFSIVFNTFCFAQNNVYAVKNEASCQGIKSFDEETGLACWTLCKKDIDIAFKSKSFDSQFTVVKIFTHLTPAKASF